MVLDILSGLIVIAFREFADAYALAAPSARGSYLPTAQFVFRYVWRVERRSSLDYLSIAVLLFSRTMPIQQFGRIVPRL
jgi:hypothetical protein